MSADAAKVTASRLRRDAWKPLTHSKVLNLLHNPAYAGAYA
jgi:hypothetical protein